jgi:multiple sugar transport system permease protein
MTTHAHVSARVGRIYPSLQLLVKRSLGYLFIAPAVIFLCAVTLYPLLDTLKTSFTEINPRDRTEEFVGLQNYNQLFNDDVLHNAVKNTAKFTVASVILHLLVGGTLALLLNEQWAGAGLRNFTRGVLILPWLFSTAASALVWGLLFHTFGILNYLLQSLGLAHKTVEFLGDRSIALYSLVLVNVWKTFPFYMVLLLGGLQAIPSELYEAGVVDGANRLQRFRYITVPLLRPIILAISTIDIITTAGHFDLVKLMTRGGPVRTTETIAYYIWQTGFRDVNFGYGAAISVAMVVVLSVGMLIYLRIFTAREQMYGDTTTTL